jgi:ankyrin repeat protein
LTPLLGALDKSNIEGFALLLAHPEVDPNQGNLMGRTPLCVASNIGEQEYVAMLLARPEVQVNLADKDGITPIFAAAICGGEQCVKLLLNHPELGLNHTCSHSDIRLRVSEPRLSPLSASVIGGANVLLTGTTITLAQQSTVHFLASRRLSSEDINATVRFLEDKRRLLTVLGVRYFKSALPVLQAELKGQRQWCAHCHRVTPGKNMSLCAGCKQVSFLRPRTNQLCNR